MILYCCIHGVVGLVDIFSFLLRGVINYFGLKKFQFADFCNKLS